MGELHPYWTTPVMVKVNVNLYSAIVTKSLMRLVDDVISMF